MKANNKIQQFSSLIIATLLILPFTLLFFSSCEQEKIYIEVPVEEEEPTVTIDRPDEVNDLIAFLHPLAHALFVDPEYIDIALEQLNAYPNSDGNFSFQGVTPSGNELQINFVVQPVPAAELFNISKEIDPENPDLVQEFENEGTSYRLYKNAECGAVQAAFQSGCENKDDGTSVQRNWYARSQCERGLSFCTEALTAGGRETTYINGNCQGVIKGERIMFLWQCQ